MDLDPQYSGGEYLLIHYGSPLITAKNTVIVPVKTGATDGFRVEAHRGDNGALLWMQATDYTLPSHNWTPSMGGCLTPDNRLVIPGGGGTVLVRENPDSPVGKTTRLAFYGVSVYNANQAAYNSSVRISTPITCDHRGNLFFGFVVTGATPGLATPLQSGLARISLTTGGGRWVSAATASGDGAMQKVAYNCAPAISNDGSVVYVGVNNLAGSGFGVGYLVGLSSQSLVPLYRVRCKDVKSPGTDAYLADDGTSSPTIGPDGDVYYGVLENPFPANHARGWLLHFNATLTVAKTRGAFGWDDTVSIVPRAAVPSYKGTSSYLLLTKYNNYAGAGGDGVNRVAVLDPNATMIEPISGMALMKEILTIAGPTPDDEHQDAQHPNAVREWCINTAAIDVPGKCALVNNEDGKLYRWDFTTNTLSEALVLTPGLGEAYTPTAVGPDGTVYAINNAILFAAGLNTPSLLPAADAMVGGGSSSFLNQGASPVLGINRAVGNGSHAAYMKFDLAGITTAPTSARLQLTVNRTYTHPVGGVTTLKVYGIANTTWTESGLTWNNAPGLDRIRVRGMGTLITTQSVPLLPDTVVSFDLTAYLAAHRNQAITLLLINETPDGNILALNSKEAPTGKPQLLLRYGNP